MGAAESRREGGSKMTVRRRKSKSVRALSETTGEKQPAFLPKDAENERERATTCGSTRLFESPEEFGVQGVAKLAQELKSLVADAGKGSEEAIERLQKFLRSAPREGYSLLMEKLPFEVVSVMKVIVEGSEDEKQIYQIASDIFSTMAEGANFILKDDIDSAAERLLKGEEEVAGMESPKSARTMKKAVWRLLHCSVITDDDGKEVVSREGFCAIACMYARGELILPLEAHESDDITSDRQQEFQQANILKKVVDYPMMTMRYSGQLVFRKIEKYGVQWLWSFFSMKKLYFLGLVYLLPMISASFILSTLATLVFFGSFLAMAISTLQVMARSDRVSRFKEYSVIFQHFSNQALGIDTHKVEVKFMQSLAVPYLTYGIALLLLTLTMGLAFQQLVVYELIASIAGFLTVAIAAHFRYWNSPIILIALLSRLLSWGDVFLHLLDEVIPLPEVVFLFGRQVIGIPVFPGFTLGLSLMSLIQIPVHLAVVLHLLVRRTWYNLFAGVGPYFLCVSWWMFCKYFVSHSSLSFLTLVAFAIPLLLILIPLLPVVIVLSPSLIFFYYGLTMELLVSLAVLFLVGCAALVLTYYYHQLKEARWLNMRFDYLFLANVVMCAIGLVVASSYFDYQYHSSQLPQVSLQQYSHLCGPEHWKESGNMLQSQLSCLHLQGRVLHGDGHVQSVRITQIFNSNAATVRSFPGSVRSAFICLMGSTDPMCGRNADAATCISRGCHFDGSNSYLVNVSIKLLVENQSLSIAADMSVSISHEHLQESILVHLRKGDQVKFNATLEAGMGSDCLSLKLKSVFINGTLHFLTFNDEDFKDAKQFVLSGLLMSVQHCLLLIFEILFGYSDSMYPFDKSSFST